MSIVAYQFGGDASKCLAPGAPSPRRGSTRPVLFSSRGPAAPLDLEGRGAGSDVHRGSLDCRVRVVE
jgi:hypothetical protein